MRKQPFKHTETKKFYQATRKRYALEEHHIKLFENACGCLDQIADDRVVLKQAGRYYTDRYGQPREHPAAISERQNKILFARLMREIGLDLVKPDDPRPPRLYGE